MNQYSDSPDIMAIGDSLYHGVHSLSFAPWMAAHSTPALVARAIGMQMVVPDPAQPLLWDLTEEIRRHGVLGLADRMPDIVRANLRHWRPDQPWSAHEAFDNIAIGGADIADLWTATDESQWQTFLDLSAYFQQDNDALIEPLLKLPDLWMALATCHTLNPRHRPEQRARSALQQVQDRAPRILLINIGSNESLFMACFMGKISFATDAERRRMRDTADTINARVRELTERLRDLPARVEKIVFNGLVMPRAVPNLMPDGQHEMEFPGDGYYQTYGPRLTNTQQTVTADALRQYDQLIAEVNATSRETLRTVLGDRAVFADLFPAAQAMDGKHHRGRGLRIPNTDVTMDNRPVTATIGGFIGGFGSLDNMHPSLPGYAVLADVVLDALGRAGVRTDKTAAFQADRLLSDFPGLAVTSFQMQIAFIASFAGLFQGRRPGRPPDA